MSQKQDPVNEVKATIPQSEVQWPHFPENPPADNIFAKWLKLLTHPDIKIFAEESSDADLFTAIYNALLYAAFFVVYTIVVIMLIGVSPLRMIPELFLFALLAALGSIVGMFIGSGLIYLAAKVSGRGNGNFTAQTYLFSVYNFPIAILSTLLGRFGLIGTIISIVLGLYGLFLTYIMIRAVHQISAFRTIIAVVVYAVLATLLLIFVFIPWLRAASQI